MTIDSLPPGPVSGSVSVRAIMLGMRAVVQRVSSAQVAVDGEVVGKITRGLLVLVAASHDDTAADARAVAAKVAGLRILADQVGKMNLSLVDTGEEALVVSQFTLYGDVRKGRRPSFVKAARPDQAQALVDEVVAELRRKGVPVATGRFGAMMEVSLINDGPVTIVLETINGRVV